MRSTLTAAVLAAVAGLAGAAYAADYSVVTDERLKNPEPRNWLMWRGNYEARRATAR